jgi:excisionase family DNA binding protein
VEILCGRFSRDFLGVCVTISEPLLTPREACELLRVSKSWLYSAAHEGRIPSIRLGDPGPVRFERSELEAWLENARAGWTPGRS